MSAVSSAKITPGMSEPIARNATASAAMTPTLAYTTVHTMVCAHCRKSHSIASPRKNDAPSATPSHGTAPR